MMLPPVLPLFPLPNVVLFPGVFLPLHIFEERYRAMTRDALAGDRISGVAGIAARDASLARSAAAAQQIAADTATTAPTIAVSSTATSAKCE